MQNQLKIWLGISYFILYFDSVVSGAHPLQNAPVVFMLHSLNSQPLKKLIFILANDCMSVGGKCSFRQPFFLSFFTGNYVHGVFMSEGFWPWTCCRKRQISSEVRLLRGSFRHWLGSGSTGVLGLPVRLDRERLDSCGELAFWLVT